MKNFLAKSVKLIYLIIFFFLLCVLGLKLEPLKVYAQEKYAELQNFSKVLNIIQQYYVDAVDSKKLIQGAMKGMLKELDPHTNYMPPEVFKDFENETSGEFGGIGIEISVVNGILTIISPIEDTPAWIAGIKPGDKIISINGQTTKNVSLVEASLMMRGKNNEVIQLSVIRGNEEKAREFKIKRGVVKIKSVKSVDLENGYLYVKITSFIENTSKDLEAVLTEAEKKSDKIKGIILDLRKNPGGLLEQAIKVSDLFLKEGIIVSTNGRTAEQQEISRASGKAKYPDVPVIVMMNEYSASASEIVAGALQDNKRALILGEKSFGKGSVQSIIKLGDGSALKLTIARYYTPSGKSIQAEGISPDVEIEQVDAEAFNKAIIKTKGTREKDISGHLLGEKEKQELKSKPTSELGKDKNPEAWWKETQNKDKKNPKDQLIASDYQVYQAYNYIKSWNMFQKFKK